MCIQHAVLFIVHVNSNFILMRSLTFCIIIWNNGKNAYSQIIYCQILFILTPKADHMLLYITVFVLLKYFSKYLGKRDLHNNLEHSVYCSKRIIQ